LVVSKIASIPETIETVHAPDPETPSTFTRRPSPSYVYDCCGTPLSFATVMWLSKFQS